MLLPLYSEGGFKNRLQSCPNARPALMAASLRPARIEGTSPVSRGYCCLSEGAGPYAGSSEEAGKIGLVLLVTLPYMSVLYRFVGRISGILPAIEKESDGE